MRDSAQQPPPRLPQLRVRFQTTGQEEHKHESSSGTSSGDDVETKVSEAASARKKPRYLSDVDRSVIIQRLQNGAKQADLAREFGVTRAAISHINKNKAELLTRFDEFARSPHGRVLIENYSRPSTEFDTVTEVRTAAASVLLTRIKDRATPPATFCASAKRLIRLLLEEAILTCGSTEYSPLPSSAGADSVPSIPAGVALGHGGLIMLDVFTEMEPEALAGQISVPRMYGDSPVSNWQVLRVDVPNLARSPVLLFVPELTSSEFVVAVIEELLSRGVSPSSIVVVCVMCAGDAVRGLVSRHREIRVITASLERPRERGSGVEQLESFAARYSSAENSAT